MSFLATCWCYRPREVEALGRRKDGRVLGGAVRVGLGVWIRYPLGQPMADVRLDKVRKVYPGGVEAVRGISLAVSDGEFVVLVGPSGCGKSTTLRMIAGLEEPTDGDIHIGDRVVTHVHPKDRDIAMVFQNYALYPHMTVRQNMAFALKLRRVARSEIDRRVLEAARLLGIEELLGRRPAALSGGQRQRVAVGRAIVREPKAFLFDEPLSNLDAKLRVTMRAELKALHMRLRTTTIYVTHDQEEAMTLGDRIVVMRDGVVQQAGPPLEVYAKPANRFVASFVGTPPMNFIEGSIVGDEGGRWFEGGGLRLRVDAAHARRLEVGQRVTLGVRPSAISEAADGHAVSLDVRVVEPLGEHMDVSCATSGGVVLVARVRARPGLCAGPARFAVDMSAVHYFEGGELGRNLHAGE